MQLQFEVEYFDGSRRRSFFADMCIDGWLLVEIDGRSKYAGADGVDVLAAEKRRQVLLEEAGFRVVRCDASEVRTRLVPRIEGGSLRLCGGRCGVLVEVLGL